MDLQNPDDPDTEHSLGRGVTESPINDRLPFMRFLGLVRSEWEPDAKRWLFRERLTWVGAIERLFKRFNPTLRNAGALPISGQTLDAALVSASQQRDTAAKPQDGWSDHLNGSRHSVFCL